MCVFLNFLRDPFQFAVGPYRALCSQVKVKVMDAVYHHILEPQQTNDRKHIYALTLSDMVLVGLFFSQK